MRIITPFTKRNECPIIFQLIIKIKTTYLELNCPKSSNLARFIAMLVFYHIHCIYGMAYAVVKSGS